MTIPGTPAQIGAELLPCPFCGGPAEHDSGHYDGKTAPGSIKDHCGHAIYCADMTCIGCPSFSTVYETAEEAIAAWNRRAPTPASRIREEALRALVDLTDAFLSRHGNFPLDQANEAQRLWHRAMSRAYELVGQPNSEQRAAILALIDAPQPLPTPPARRTEQGEGK